MKRLASLRMLDEASHLGDLYIVLDWSNSSAHQQLVHFASDLIGNLSNQSGFSPYVWGLTYSLLLFHNDTGATARKAFCVCAEACG